MRIKSSITLVTCLVFAFVVLNRNNAIAQDFEGILVYKTTGSDEESSKIYLMSDKIRIDEKADKQTTIIRLDKEVMLNINHRNKTYNEVSFAQIRQQMSQAKDAVAQAKAKMTPQQREMMKKMGVKIPGMSDTPKEKMFELKKTGEKASINGYKCRKYLFINKMTNSTEEMWVTQDLGSAKNFGRIMSKMMESMGFGEQMGSMAAFAEIEGIPVRLVDDGDISELTHAQKGGVKESDFDAPIDYDKKEMGGMGSYN